MNTSDLKLVYVNPIGQDSEGNYEYEFFLSETPDIVWGENWAEPCASACSDMLPQEDTYSEVIKVKTENELNLAVNNSCFSMQDCIDGVISLWWLDDGENVYTCRFATDFDEIKDKFSEILNIIES